MKTLFASALLILPSIARAQSALTDGLQQGTRQLAAQIGQERQQRAATSGPDAVIRRTSCSNDVALVEEASGRTVRSHEVSLQTSSSWLVGGQRYDLVYYFEQSDGRQPYPLLGQLISRETPQDAGTLSVTDARMLMQLPGGGFQDVPVHRESYSEKTQDGHGTLYAWENGAKGRPLTSGVETRLPDGRSQTVSRELDQTAHGGWRDAGSVFTCTAAEMSRATWLALAGDPAMANEITTLDALSYAVSRAEQAQAPDLDAQKAAFLAAWNNVYSNRKAALQRKIEQARRAERRRRSTVDQCDGVCWALRAIESAKQQSAINEQKRMADELEQMKQELERRHRR